MKPLELSEIEIRQQLRESIVSMVNQDGLPLQQNNGPNKKNKKKFNGEDMIMNIATAGLFTKDELEKSNLFSKTERDLVLQQLIDLFQTLSTK